MISDRAADATGMTPAEGDACVESSGAELRLTPDPLAGTGAPIAFAELGGPEIEECGVTLGPCRCRWAPHSGSEHYDSDRKQRFTVLPSI